MLTPSHRAHLDHSIYPNLEASPVKLELLLRYIFGRFGYFLGTADDDAAS